MASWRDYQEEVAVFFRTLGLTADTDVTLQGVRTSHDVDVVVKSRHAGFEVLWLVECKAWKSAVPKEKVLALRSIVDDVGADRGFVMAEGGYQSGTLQAARFANVVLTSLANLRETLAYELGLASLSSLDARIGRCRDRYWAIDKQDRFDLGLRPDVGASGFMGDVLLKAVEQRFVRRCFEGSLSFTTARMPPWPRTRVEPSTPWIQMMITRSGRQPIYSRSLTGNSVSSKRAWTRLRRRCGEGTSFLQVLPGFSVGAKPLCSFQPPCRRLLMPRGGRLRSPGSAAMCMLGPRVWRAAALDSPG